MPSTTANVTEEKEGEKEKKAESEDDAVGDEWDDSTLPLVTLEDLASKRRESSMGKERS